jgi:hypothetical protein
MLNYQLFQKLKLIERYKFNYLIITITIIIYPSLFLNSSLYVYDSYVDPMEMDER